MSYFDANFSLREWYGDFGGTICTDGDAFNNAFIQDKVLAGIKDPKFDELFTKNLKLIKPEMPEIKEYKISGKTVYVAPAMSRYYNLAGQITTAILAGYDTVKAGCFSAELAKMFALLAKENNLKAEIVLARCISNDEDLLTYLKQYGCAYNNTICLEQVDEPYGILQPPFFKPDFYHVVLEGNIGGGFKPATVSAFAGIYGRNLGKRMCDKVKAVVVPITTGTEALGVIGGMKTNGYDLTYVTVEEAICQEIHMGETGTYTISTRSVDDGSKMYTTMCPEVVNMWREAEVKRYGADHQKHVCTEAIKELNLNKSDARALGIALARLQEDSILFIGGNK